MQQNLIDYNHHIATHYGYHRQCEQLIEEMAELTQAIIKKRRFENGTLYKLASQNVLDYNIIEEIADVKIVLEQLIYLMDAQGMVDRFTEEKIAREMQRIAENSKR